MKEFYAAHAIGAPLRARALVAADNFSARYDLDRINGTFSRPGHLLAGRSYAGLILVLNAVKGGAATAWMLHDMKARGLVPAAFVFNRVNPIMVQGAAFAGITLMSGFDLDITAAIPDGALIALEPESTPPLLRIL